MKTWFNYSIVTNMAHFMVLRFVPYCEPSMSWFGHRKALLEFLMKQVSGEAQLYVVQNNYPDIKEFKS